MAGDKRKSKVAAEPKKKKTHQEKKWERVFAVADTQGQPQRGIRIGEGAQRQGGCPRVSSSSHNSSYNAQAGVSRLSRQRHLHHFPGLVLGLMEDTHSRLRDRGEQQLRR
jgi:hypothetical protein